LSVGGWGEIIDIYGKYRGPSTEICCSELKKSLTYLYVTFLNILEYVVCNGIGL
jgi:hypothetical protein